MKRIPSLSLIVAAAVAAPHTSSNASELHVAITGNDSNRGTRAAPLRTIHRAADLAQPGDVITVHKGVYRERVNPPRGGTSNSKRIVYQAARGEKVEIEGSEMVRNWVKVQNDVWQVTLPNSFFHGFNPYSDLIHGDWFDGRGRDHHTGAVYLNGAWLIEAGKLEDVLMPVGSAPAWFARVDRANTTILAQFPGVNPNRQHVEINVRRTVFYPDKPNRDYITVRGFIMRHAATPWAPPTAEQIGLIGTHWSKGWIIEDNTISHSTCAGISLGKYGDEWDNKSANSAEGYVETIQRALRNGWSKENIGHHVVRRNHISHCEQAGIVGSMGAVFSEVYDNTIHDIHVRKLFSGAEMAGIKFHGAIDTIIRNNHIYHTCLGLWLDWMAQGTRVSSNIFHDNGTDLFTEVDHGPFVVDNNLFLSPNSYLTISRGGAFAHNLFGGAINVVAYDGRQTPFHKPHSTAVAGYHDNLRGDDRYYNNVFVGPADLSQYDDAKLPVWMDGNVFLKGAKPSLHEKDPIVDPGSDSAIRFVEQPNGLYLQAIIEGAWRHVRKRSVVNTALLGKAAIPDLPFEQPDGTPISITTDILGKRRNVSNPTVGPLENPGDGPVTIRLR